MEYKLCSGVVLEKVDGSCVLVKDCGDVAVLNETAGFVFENLMEHKSPETISKLIIKEYETDEKTVLYDTEKVITELMKKGLLEIHNGEVAVGNVSVVQ